MFGRMESETGGAGSRNQGERSLDQAIKRFSDLLDLPVEELSSLLADVVERAIVKEELARRFDVRRR